MVLTTLEEDGFCDSDSVAVCASRKHCHEQAQNSKWTIL